MAISVPETVTKGTGRVSALTPPVVFPRRARALRGRGYVKDARRGRDRREIGPKTRLGPRTHACGACPPHTRKSSAALGKVKLWTLKVDLPANLCEKPPSEGCGGFQSLEGTYQRRNPSTSPAMDSRSSLRAGIFAGLPLPFITCGPRTLAQAELMFLFFYSSVTLLSFRCAYYFPLSLLLIAYVWGGWRRKTLFGLTSEAINTT